MASGIRGTETTRRRVLLAVLAAVPAFPGPAWAARRAPAERLLAILGDRAAAGRVGRAYLAAHPDEADAARLVARLWPEGPDALLAGSTDAVRDRLARRRREEFGRGETVRVDGWVLAASEARLAALAAVA